MRETEGFDAIALANPVSRLRPRAPIVRSYEHVRFRGPTETVSPPIHIGYRQRMAAVVGPIDRELIFFP